MQTASIISSFWGDLEANHEQAVFLVLVGLLGSFAFIRMSTRIIRSGSVSWWPGNIESESGVHLHHLVFGIVTMMVAGTLAFVADGRSPYLEICALGFGVGVGLTIDEFALWVHLEDVYWAREGRSSIDATVVAVSLMMLMVLGVSPVVIESGSPEAIIGSIIGTLLAFGFVVVAFLKGRTLHAVVGIFVVPIAIYATCRIGKPTSFWAKRKYGERKPKKQAKAVARFPADRRTERFKDAFRDIVGGKPSEGLAAVGDEAMSATREAGAGVMEAGAGVIETAGRITGTTSETDDDEEKKP